MHDSRVRPQMFMNLATTALIVLDLSWLQDAVIESESTGYSSLTRALVLASQAGRMTRLLRIMRLVQLGEVCHQPLARCTAWRACQVYTLSIPMMTYWRILEWAGRYSCHSNFGAPFARPVLTPQL